MHIVTVLLVCVRLVCALHFSLPTFERARVLCLFSLPTFEGAVLHFFFVAYFRGRGGHLTHFARRKQAVNAGLEGGPGRVCAFNIFLVWAAPF